MEGVVVRWVVSKVVGKRWLVVGALCGRMYGVGWVPSPWKVERGRFVVVTLCRLTDVGWVRLGELCLFVRLTHDSTGSPYSVSKTGPSQHRSVSSLSHVSVVLG